MSEWAEVLPDHGIEPFHTASALDVITRHVPGKLHLIGGFKGDEPVGLLPIHERRKLGGRLLTSPPLSLGIGRLGPLVPLALLALAGYLVTVEGGPSASIWILWGLLTLVLSRVGGVSPLDDSPVGPGRRAVAVLTLVLGVACFTPVPIALTG